MPIVSQAVVLFRAVAKNRVKSYKCQNKRQNDYVSRASGVRASRNGGLIIKQSSGF